MFSRADLINRHIRNFHPDEPRVERRRKLKRDPEERPENGHPVAPSTLSPSPLQATWPTSNHHVLLEINGFAELNGNDVSHLGGFDLLAAVSTLSPCTPSTAAPPQWNP